MIIASIGSSIMLFLQTIIYDVHVNVIFTSQMLVEPALINDSHN
jgi:hypothetical protein